MNKKMKNKSLNILLISLLIIMLIGINLIIIPKKAIAATPTWQSLEIGDEVELVDGSKWYVVRASDSSKEDVMLISAYNVNIHGAQEKGTLYRIPFNENNSTDNNYSRSTILNFINNTFLSRLKVVLKEKGGVTDDITAELLSGSDFLNIIAKFYDSTPYVNSGVTDFMSLTSYNLWLNRLSQTQQNIYFAPTWLWENSFWLVEGGWVASVFNIAGAPYCGNIAITENMSDR